jgi:hypothetical protein
LSPLTRRCRGEDDERCLVRAEADEFVPECRFKVLGDLEAIRKVERPVDLVCVSGAQIEWSRINPLASCEETPESAVLVGDCPPPEPLRLCSERATPRPDVDICLSTREETSERSHYSRRRSDGLLMVVAEHQWVVGQPVDIPSLACL